MKMKISWILECALSIVLAAPGALRGAEPPATLRLVLPEGPFAVQKRLEIGLEGVPACENPFDPDSLAVDLEAAPPSGRAIHLPAFFSRDFDRKLEGDREVLTARGEPGWRARYLPLEPGAHALAVTARSGGKVLARGAARIEVSPAKLQGFVRLEEKGKRYFRFDDGTPLFLNGLCACWHGSRGTYDYDDWLPAYRKAGINYMRLWMWHVAFGIEYHEKDRLRYRLERAWTLDRVLDESERLGIWVMLCFDYHGILEVKPDFWKSNNEWPRHPYNAANGGPCKDQNEFFTSPEARKLYEKRLRYIVGRWAASRSVFAWEFFNEIDNVYAYLKHPDVVAWHCEMARRLRAMDPYRHLISSSFTGGSERGDLFALPEMEFSQYHSYNEKHPADMMASKSAKFFERYGKPFFVSEYGTDFRGWKPDTDPHLRALHQAIWSGAFTGAAGTGMTWWWESIHAANLYRHWSALSAFLEGTAIASPDMKPLRLEVKDNKAKAFGVGTGKEALLWLLDPAFNWPEGALEAVPAPLAGVEVTVHGLEGGNYRAEWWDTLEGKKLREAEAKAESGRLRIEAPPFPVDIACRIRPR